MSDDKVVTYNTITGDLPTLVEMRITDIAGDAGPGGSAITVQDEGTPLTTAASTLNFVGPAVTASGTGGTKTIAVSGAESVNVVASTGSTETLPAPDVSPFYSIHNLTLTADCAITLPSGFDATKGYSILVWLDQPSSGGTYDYTATWVGSVTWADTGTPPIIATGQGSFTGVVLETEDGGATWRGIGTVIDPGNQGVTLSIVSGHVATAANVGDVFDLTLTQNVIMDAPTGLTKNKKILYRISQDATGSRTVDFITNPIFRFSTDVPVPFLSTSPHKTDYIGFIYNAADSKLDCLAVARGY